MNDKFKNKNGNYEFGTCRFMRNKGFTLIELLVVITIMIVLSAVAMVSFTGAGKKSRDSKRMADLEKIRISLEMARQVGNTYPSTLTPLVTLGYMSIQPKDPKTGNFYTYAPTSYTYTLDAVMEDLGSTNMSGMVYRVVNP